MAKHPGVGPAKQILRSFGEDGRSLAAKLSRLSRLRNTEVHDSQSAALELEVVAYLRPSTIAGMNEASDLVSQKFATNEVAALLCAKAAVEEKATGSGIKHVGNGKEETKVRDHKVSSEADVGQLQKASQIIAEQDNHIKAMEAKLSILLKEATELMEACGGTPVPTTLVIPFGSFFERVLEYTIEGDGQDHKDNDLPLLRGLQPDPQHEYH